MSTNNTLSDETPAVRPPRKLWASLKRIWAFAWPYRWRLLASLLLASLASVVWLVVPLGLRELLDAVFEDADGLLLNQLTIRLLVLFVLQALFSFAGFYLLEWTGERVVADLRQRIYRHLHRLGLRFYANQRIGDLTSRLTNDVGTIRQAVTSALVESFTQTLMLVGSVALMVMLNWRLSLLIFVVVPVATIAARYFGRKIRRLARGVQDRLADTTAIAEEAIGAIRVVKAFGRDRYETDRYHDAVETLFETARHKVLVSKLFGSVIGLLFMAALTAIFWFGGREVLQGRLTTGDLVAFIFYAFNIARSVGGMSSLYATFNSAAGATERIFELLDATPDVPVPTNPRPLPRVEGEVSFDNVRFVYGDGPEVLRGIDLQVAPGETVALVGPSGAGKTTLLNLIPRFYDVTAGTVLIDGVDVREVAPQELRQHMAVVPQEVHLFGTSVRENIRYGRLDATDEEVEAAARAANAHEFIAELPDGYDAQVGERGVKLSAGQRQRVSIARAILRDARILLLDEATSALDAASEALVQDALDRLMQHRTTFIIAHRLATVRDVDRIIVVKDGQIIEQGRHEALVQQEGLYRELAALQLL